MNAVRIAECLNDPLFTEDSRYEERGVDVLALLRGETVSTDHPGDPMGVGVVKKNVEVSREKVEPAGVVACVLTLVDKQRLEG